MTESSALVRENIKLHDFCFQLFSFDELINSMYIYYHTLWFPLITSNVVFSKLSKSYIKVLHWMLRERISIDIIKLNFLWSFAKSIIASCFVSWIFYPRFPVWTNRIPFDDSCIEIFLCTRPCSISHQRYFLFNWLKTWNIWFKILRIIPICSIISSQTWCPLWSDVFVVIPSWVLNLWLHEKTVLC